jgi:hypothetical protein
LYLRDLKPAVMFHIRQLLEVFGRNLIGYYSIDDKNGNPIKKFTQVAWEFLKEEIKRPTPRIEFPFNLHMILAINNWANSFVHTTHLYNSYIQFYALKTIRVIFSSPSQNGIRIHKGTVIKKNNCADIKITNYNLLKTDFDTYLKSKMPNISIEWMDIDDVGAYVISL